MLRVHFLNVGHGDCTLVEHHSGRLTMVDINTSQEYDRASFSELLAEEEKKRLCNPLGGFGADSGVSAVSNTLFGGLGGFGAPAASGLGLLGPLTAYGDAVTAAKRELVDPIAFIQQHYPGRRLWRFVLTHPDLDHMRGLKRLYETIGFNNFWDTAHTKPTPNYRSDGDKLDWEFYQRLRSGSLGLVPLFYTRGDAHFAFMKDEVGQTGGDWIEILSPTPDLVKTCNAAGKSNDLSFVLRLWHIGKSVLLPGDAEGLAWDDLVV
jgi:competence protein ComEC